MLENLNSGQFPGNGLTEETAPSQKNFLPLRNFSPPLSLADPFFPIFLLEESCDIVPSEDNIS
jgi:hypothetical protein